MTDYTKLSVNELLEMECSSYITDDWAQQDLIVNELARRAREADALRSEPQEPEPAPTIRVRACIAIVNGKQWGIMGCHEWSDRAMAAQAHDIAGVFQSDNVQVDWLTVDVPLRQPAELTGAVEPQPKDGVP